VRRHCTAGTSGKLWGGRGHEVSCIPVLEILAGFAGVEPTLTHYTGSMYLFDGYLEKLYPLGLY
jgi:hypothetical protein